MFRFAELLNKGFATGCATRLAAPWLASFLWARRRFGLRLWVSSSERRANPRARAENELFKDPLTCVLTVSSNEPTNGLGDGDTAPDWEVIDDHHLRLRAERAGKGTGRIYTITTTCTDASNNSITKTSTVLVPKSMKGGSWAMVAIPGKGAKAEPHSSVPTAEPLEMGMVNFDFDGKSFSRSGRSGNLVNLLLGKVDFRALGYESKSVSGAKTQFRGLGTVNNTPGYRYILTVSDGQAAGGDGVDRFRLRIWNEKTGDTIFDNQMGASDDAEPTTVVGDGNSIKLP